MMKNRNNTTNPVVMTTSALLFLLCSPSSQANPTFEVTAETSFSDNANKAGDANAINERQDKIGLNVLWEKRFDFNAQAEVDYNLAYEHFEKDSSDNEFNLNGKSEINFVLSPNYSANLNHSIKQVLNDPEVSETNNNLEERNIYGAEFTAMYTPTSTQTIYITPSIQEIDNGDNESQNSTRIGLTGGWELRLDGTSAISVSYETTQIDYEANTQDQDYDKLLFGYNKTHRLFAYNVDVGLNRYSSNGSDTEEPYFYADLAYNGSTHIFKVSANRTLTDTSFGDGNLEDQLSSIDGNRISLEQLEKDRIRASYQYLNLCNHCTLKLDFQLNNEDYTSAPISDLEETVFSAVLEYNIDSKSSINGRISHSEIEYPNQPSHGYDLQKAAITYRRTMDRDWYWLVFTEYEEKDPTDGTSIIPYSEWNAGVKVGYQF